MTKINIVDFFFEGEACRIGITTEQLEKICGIATNEELDQLLGENFQPILDKYLKINEL